MTRKKDKRKKEAGKFNNTHSHVTETDMTQTKHRYETNTYVLPIYTYMTVHIGTYHPQFPYLTVARNITQ